MTQRLQLCMNHPEDSRILFLFLIFSRILTLVVSTSCPMTCPEFTTLSTSTNECPPTPTCNCQTTPICNCPTIPSGGIGLNCWPSLHTYFYLFFLQGEMFHFCKANAERIFFCSLQLRAQQPRRHWGERCISTNSNTPPKWWKIRPYAL